MSFSFSKECDPADEMGPRDCEFYKASCKRAGAQHILFLSFLPRSLRSFVIAPVSSASNPWVGLIAAFPLNCQSLGEKEREWSKMIIEIITKSSAREENSDCLQDAGERRELIYTINISLGLCSRCYVYAGGFSRKRQQPGQSKLWSSI